MAVKEPCEIIIQKGSKSKRYLTPILKTTMAQQDLGATDPRMRVITPYSTDQIIHEDEHLCISLRLVSEDGIDYTDSKVEVPATIKEGTAGVKTSIWVGNTGQYQFTFLADGTVFQADVEKLWAWFQVPKGMAMVLGHRGEFTSRLYVIPYDDT